MVPQAQLDPAIMILAGVFFTLIGTGHITLGNNAQLIQRRPLFRKLGILVLVCGTLLLVASFVGY